MNAGRPGCRLALATCGPQLEVALEPRPGAVPSVVRLSGGKPRSTLLLAAVDLLMENSGLEPSAVSTVVVSRGPGSFTGIRAGLATASGLRSATGAAVIAYDSLTMLAARCSEEMTVWSAQPGRRGEVYARPFEVGPRRTPVPVGEIEIVPVAAAAERRPWVAAADLDLGEAVRAEAGRTSSEALLYLHAAGAPEDAVEPLYVEGPPIHQSGNGH